MLTRLSESKKSCRSARISYCLWSKCSKTLWAQCTDVVKTMFMITIFMTISWLIFIVWLNNSPCQRVVSAGAVKLYQLSLSHCWPQFISFTARSADDANVCLTKNTGGYSNFDFNLETNLKISGNFKEICPNFTYKYRNLTKIFCARISLKFFSWWLKIWNISSNIHQWARI